MAFGGTSITATCGSCSRTQARSTGLSSKNTSASRPTLSSSAMARRLVALSCQWIWRAAKSVTRSTMSGCWASASSTSASLFLLAIASSTPRSA
jgi:hypothetical protein